jgi:TonB family protein
VKNLCADKINTVTQWLSRTHLARSLGASVIIFAWLLPIGTSHLNAQNGEIYTITERMPEPEGGISAVYKYIGQTIKYPESARQCLLGGKVFIKFVVNEAGGLQDVSIIKGSGLIEFDTEALTVVRNMPIKWAAAEQGNKRVKCYFNLPITFALDNHPYFINNPANNTEEYRTLMNMVMSGRGKEAKETVTDEMRSSGNGELLFVIALLEYHYGKKKKFCPILSDANRLANGASYQTYSAKFSKLFCAND